MEKFTFSKNAIALLTVFVFFLPLSFKSQNTTDSLSKIESFGLNRANLKMFLYNPFTKKDTLTRPLLLVLHGCSQRAKDVAALTGWNKIAKENSFYVVYPEQNIMNNPSMCFNWFLEKNIEREKGETGSVYDMIVYMKKHFKIDSTSIFITGLSAGAEMTVAMLSDYPEVFKAGASFAGGPFKSATTLIGSPKAMLNPSQKSQAEWTALVKKENPAYKGNYPKLIIYHGENDKVVNPRNAAQLILQWSGVHHTDTVADKTETAYKKIDDINRYTYTDSSKKEVIIYYKIKNCGHALLINPGAGKDEGGKNGLFSIDKDFHSTYQTAIDFGLIRE